MEYLLVVGAAAVAAVVAAVAVVAVAAAVAAVAVALAAFVRLLLHLVRQLQQPPALPWGSLLSVVLLLCSRSRWMRPCLLLGTHKLQRQQC